MPETVTLLPARRQELLLSPLGENGQHVIKDPHSGKYFSLGEEESFLFSLLDGQHTADTICWAFQERFGQPLTAEEIEDFVGLARSQGFLDLSRRPGKEKSPDHRAKTSEPKPEPEKAPRRWRPQSLLYWRKRFFDPDRFFTWLEPRIRCVWTVGFLVVSAIAILAAGVVLATNWYELVHLLPHALRKETLVLAWLTLLVVTFCHEFAHGLTCKHYGGEVHEVGFLLMFLMPCFYCNVSDAWLFREKSKRFWVMLAGGYCDLILWAVAVFVWRLTQPFTLTHSVACLVLSICGGRVLINLNPLLRMDGYYLLSDWAEIPNLRQRSWVYVKAQLRHLLWGGPSPEPESRVGFLVVYGVVSWLFSVLYLILMLAAFAQLWGFRWGLLGVAAVIALGFVILKSVFKGFTGGEVVLMIATRRKRTMVWATALGGLAALLVFGRMEDRAGGTFHIRPTTRAELRAPIPGFLHEVFCDEGDRVSQGSLVALLEVPDLASRTAQKHAEVEEAQAKLRLLEAGPRPVEIIEQRHRVERAKTWRNLAEQDLGHLRQALQDELAKLEKQVAQFKAERDFSRSSSLIDKDLMAKGSVAPMDYLEKKKTLEVNQSQLEQALAQKRARQTLGTQEAEGELAKREKELADAQATLTLLEAGTRPEEIDAERAHLARLKEEARYLESLQQKVRIASPVPGLVTTPRQEEKSEPSSKEKSPTTTPRLKEKVGQYFKEGELICTVEEPSHLEAEVGLHEQEVDRVEPGQTVDLKVRALPFRTFAARVDRIAPSALPGEAQSTITVYCRLEDSVADLRPGMSGYARIYRGKRPIGEVLAVRLLSYLRTEFWW